MTEKHVRDMSAEEAAAELARIKRGLPPELPPLDVSRRAAEMSAAERAEWWKQHRKRFP